MRGEHQKGTEAVHKEEAMPLTRLTIPLTSSCLGHKRVHELQVGKTLKRAEWWVGSKLDVQMSVLLKYYVAKKTKNQFPS